ncbi:hypothetical protein [Paenibacillus nasutitermitis]|uniref:Uncharacterized protein n=1 Tax=Paenibacillus nasutitermitis TaxID=1652958 RepID=A0A916ZGT3_9BACL|nr:hypothetical protein [Paenibacillus nasutitermitis]GGD97147.1 hypothetical protein GCM10010911_64850 [Paenibacillus nasutitermitis]
MHIYQFKPGLQGAGRTAEFLRENYVGMDWPGIGNAENMSGEHILHLLGQMDLNQAEEHTQLIRFEEIMMFCHQMKDGDYLLMMDEDRVHLGDLGDYYYLHPAGTEETSLHHRRGVTWLKSFEREELNKELQQFLLRPDTISRFDRPFSQEQFEGWATKSEEETGRVHVDTQTIQRAIEVLQEAMQSDDADRRVRAAIAILQYAK